MDSIVFLLVSDCGFEQSMGTSQAVELSKAVSLSDVQRVSANWYSNEQRAPITAASTKMSENAHLLSSEVSLLGSTHSGTESTDVQHRW